MTDVVQFPQTKPPELLVGPFEYWKVVVDGRAIPNLTGHREADGIWFTIDHRLMGGPFDEAAAYQAANLIAQGMAVAAGYSHAGAASKDMPFAPQLSPLPPSPRSVKPEET